MIFLVTPSVPSWAARGDRCCKGIAKNCAFRCFQAHQCETNATNDQRVDKKLNNVNQLILGLRLSLSGNNTPAHRVSPFEDENEIYQHFEESVEVAQTSPQTLAR